jgi:type IV pilus assembly protein PilW
MNQHKGFSLIEVLIGLTIGLIALLAVAQVFVTFNKQRTTATQTMEAQSNGAMAIYLIERDLALAGFALMGIQDCALIQWYWNPPGCTGASCGLQNPLSTQPVKVYDGGANSDRIEINYGHSTSGTPGAQITQDQVVWGDDYHVASTTGISIGDMIVADVSGSCTMSQETSKDFNALTIQHAPNQYNPAAAPPAGAAGGWEAAKLNNLLVNLGSYISNRYQIASNTLQVASFPQVGTYNTVVEGIMLLKAQYGVDDGSNGGTPNDGIVDAWVNGTATGALPVGVTSTSVLAMRIGVVARSPLLEKDPVVLQDSAGNTITALTVLPAINGGAAVTWNIPDDHYRYKVYYTLIPLRNVIWGRPD